jgi:MFS family permease
MLLLKESRIVSRPRVDLAGVALMSGSLLFLMAGLNLAGESFSIPSILLTALLVVVSLFLAVLFLRQEKRAAEPIFDIALLQSTPFAAANATNLVVGITVTGVFSFIPFYATSVHGLSTLMSGVILTPRSLAMAVAAAVASLLLKRWGYRWPMVLGFCLSSLTTMLLAPGLSLWGVAGARWGIIKTLSLLLFLNGIGGGVVFPAANNACIELMPDKVDTIVGLRIMFRNVGAAIGVSLVTLILHLSSGPASGFTIVFISFGLAFLASVPLIFLMPAGRKASG